MSDEHMMPEDWEAVPKQGEPTKVVKVELTVKLISFIDSIAEEEGLSFDATVKRLIVKGTIPYFQKRKRKESHS
jgi:hypothetical protein